MWKSNPKVLVTKCVLLGVALLESSFIEFEACPPTWFTHRLKPNWFNSMSLPYYVQLILRTNFVV